jgi:hypothetical protein
MYTTDENLKKINFFLIDKKQRKKKTNTIDLKM